MTKTNKLKENHNWTSAPYEVKEKGNLIKLTGLKDPKLIKLSGITTSQIRKREKLSDTPAYCFLKAECKNCSKLAHVDLECKECNANKEDIPIIFRIKEGSNWLKPKIPKYSYLQVQGHYSNSDKKRPSFTAYSFHILSSQPATENLNQIEQNIN